MHAHVTPRRSPSFSSSLWRIITRPLRLGLNVTMSMPGLRQRNEMPFPRVERLTLRWPTLPPDLHGLRIVQLSDFHAAPYMDPALLRAGVQLGQAQSGDLIVLTGDFITYPRHAERYARQAAAIVGTLRAPLGVYAVLGNHDYWADPGIVVRAVEAAGIPMLINTARPIRVGQTDVWLVGLDDARLGRPNLDLALTPVPDHAFKVALVHEPDTADHTARFGVQLQLSGHSHGGQITLPGGRPIFLPSLGRKYPAGLYRVGRTWLYTNRGLGAGYPPVRLNCPPEITVITLARGGSVH